MATLDNWPRWHSIQTGRPHVTYYELPLDAANSTGMVFYAVGPEVVATAVVLEAVSDQSVTASHALDQNFPNPFNPSTTIQFHLPDEGFIELSIFDPTGRLVRRLDSQFRSAGSYTVTWDGNDAAGRAVGPGLYFSRLRGRLPGESFEHVRKMLLVR